MVNSVNTYLNAKKSNFNLKYVTIDFTKPNLSLKYILNDNFYIFC